VTGLPAEISTALFLYKYCCYRQGI